jgi:hypothetical protein
MSSYFSDNECPKCPKWVRPLLRVRWILALLTFDGELDHVGRPGTDLVLGHAAIVALESIHSINLQTKLNQDEMYLHF